MTWTEKQIAHLKAHLEEKWTSTSCQMCGANDWRFAGPYWIWGTDKLLIGGPKETIPVAAVVCYNCGVSHFVNTIVCGLDLDEAE